MKKAGINPDKVKDFSVSINPVNLPSSIQKVIQESAIYRYPDSRSRNLVEKLSREYSYPEDEIMVVNGSSQAIFLIASAYLKPGDKTLISSPTYSEYLDAAEVSGAEIIEYRTKAENHFKIDGRKISRIIRTEQPKVFWICSPNNPTGSLLEESELKELIGVCRESGCIMVLDEAYRCFAPPDLLPELSSSGVISLRSMTKDFCIPGLRLGWLRAEAIVIKTLLRRQPDWSVSAPAQDAGSACMDQLDYFKDSWKKTGENTAEMANRLKALGLEVYPSFANFILVRIGDDNEVKTLEKKLWKELLLIRNCASFGLEGFIRIGTRSVEDIDILLKNMERNL